MFPVSCSIGKSWCGDANRIPLALDTVMHAFMNASQPNAAHSRLSRGFGATLDMSQLDKSEKRFTTPSKEHIERNTVKLDAAQPVSDRHRLPQTPKETAL